MIISKLLGILVLYVTFSSTQGKLHIFNKAYHELRGKRQLHPATTIALIGGNLTNEEYVPPVGLKTINSNADYPAPADYLVPPKSDAEIPTAVWSLDKDHTSLDYDASKLLVPPSTQYGTLKETSEEKVINGDAIVSSSDRVNYKSPRNIKPVYSFVKTDKNGYFRWGVRHGT